MKPITVDIINNKVIMTRAFAAKAADPYSNEYAKLQDIKEAFPGIQIVNHKIKKNPNKEHYKGLTYDYMKRYIAAHETEETIEEAMAELSEELFKAEGHSVRYPHVKKWFLERYKDFANFGKELEEFNEERKMIGSVELDEELLEVA